MAKHEFNPPFQSIVSLFEIEWEVLDAAERELAFRVEPRPIPKDLIYKRPPPGHIAFMGDFETPTSPNLHRQDSQNLEPDVHLETP